MHAPIAAQYLAGMEQRWNQALDRLAERSEALSSLAASTFVPANVARKPLPYLKSVLKLAARDSPR